MLRLLILILLLGGLALGAMRFVSNSSDTAPAHAFATGTPREVYCRLPVARTAGGAAQLHTDYNDCMQKSDLPPLKDFSPEQQAVYMKMGLGGR